MERLHGLLTFGGVLFAVTELNRFDDASKYQQQMLDEPDSAGYPVLREDAQERLKAYAAQKPWRE